MTPLEIQELVEEKTNLNIKVKSRDGDIVIAKRVYFYIGRMLYDISNAKLCKHLGLNHSTASVHYDKAVSWVEQKDIRFCSVLNHVIGYQLITGVNIRIPGKKKSKTNTSDIFELNKIIPDEHRDEAYERIKAMINGYNMVHGVDKVTVIKGYD